MTASIRVVSAFPAVLVLLALAGPGHAACLDDDRVAELVADYPTTPVTGIPPDLSLDDAYCTQAKYHGTARPHDGPSRRLQGRLHR